MVRPKNEGLAPNPTRPTKVLDAYGLTVHTGAMKG
jgi:hypothetical protein